MQCPNCFATNPDDADYCTECGHKVHQQTIPTATIALDPIKCATCGRDLPPYSANCPFCSATSVTLPPQTAPITPSSPQIDLSWIIILVLGLVAIIFAPNRWLYILMATGGIGLLWLFFRKYPLPALMLIGGIVALIASIVTKMIFIFPIVLILMLIGWFVLRDRM